MARRLYIVCATLLTMAVGVTVFSVLGRVSTAGDTRLERSSNQSSPNSEAQIGDAIPAFDREFDASIDVPPSLSREAPVDAGCLEGNTRYLGTHGRTQAWAGLDNEDICVLLASEDGGHTFTRTGVEEFLRSGWTLASSSSSSTATDIDVFGIVPTDFGSRVQLIVEDEALATSEVHEGLFSFAFSLEGSPDEIRSSVGESESRLIADDGREGYNDVTFPGLEDFLR